MKKVMKVVTIVGNILAGFSMLALLILLAITIADVVMRYFFRSPITGTVEIARMMMVCMVPAFVVALIEKRHIAVGFIVDMFGRKVQLAFDTVGYLLGAILMGLMSYQGFIDTYRRLSGRHVYTMLRIPTWPFYMLFTVSVGVLAIVIIICLVDNFLNKDLYVKVPRKEEA